MRNRNNPLIAASFSLLFLLLPAEAALGISDPGLTGRIETAITEAADLFEQGKILKGRPHVVDVAPGVQLTFSQETFERDMETAFLILEMAMTRRSKDASKSLAGAPRSGATAEQPRDRMSALIAAERQTAAKSRQSDGQIPADYSMHKNYQQMRQARTQSEEKEIEAERQIVLAERAAAAQNLQRRREREAQLQAQSAKWQDELDRQAKVSAQAAAQWEAEHSFGAYAKRFLGVVVQTSVGAFTGAFLGTVATNLADKAVKKLFPGASTSTTSQAAAAGTSAAITSTATTAGQAAVSGITGQGQSQPQPQTQTTTQGATPSY
ncbi:MAG: hypothetical protein AABY65_13320 [Nitrospirota bacterium]